jgi:autotransporter-associated beta strand protein
VKALVPDLIEVAAFECQADTMWSMNPRDKGISTLAKHKVVEAMPVALAMLVTPPGFGWGQDQFKVPALNALATYGDAARWMLPTLKGHLLTWDPASTEYATLNTTIASISSATTPVSGLTNLFPVASSQVVTTTNAKAITLTGFSCRTNTVTFMNVTAPVHGTLTGTAPNLTYTPTGSYVGLDSFTFQVCDSLTNSAPGTVSLIVGMAAGTGLKGEYYDNINFTGLKFTRTDPQVSFDWSTGSPSNSMAADTFSVRWSGLLLAPESGNYMFSTLNSDGVRLYVNGVLVIDDFVDQGTSWNDGTAIALTAGQKYEVQMAYYENTGSAVARLKWTGPSFAGTNGVLLAKEWLYDGTGVSNRAAIAYPQSVTMLQNTNRAIILEGAGNPTFSIGTSPAHGTLTGTPPNVTYTPATNFSGLDSFTFVVNNGLSNSAPATVSIAVWAGAPVSYTWKSAASGYWSVAGNWISAVPAAAGDAFYIPNFTPSGTYSVTNDLNSGFVLNQLNVAGSVTFAGANSLSPTANGPLLPQINQNSASAVTFSTPLSLAAMTILGGTAGGRVTIPSLISGVGGLTKNSPGMLEIYGLNANTYSGGTIINSGTLHWGTITNGISPPCNFALGTGPVTLAYNATLEFDRVTATNALISNGGTLVSANGWGVTWNGPVTLNTNTTADTEWNMTFGGNINGAGGFTKTGGKTLTFSGTNNFTGANFVTSGTLSCSKSAALGTGPLSISDGVIVNLNYTGTRTIAALTLGGTNQPAGTYGSTSFPAAKKDAHFTGTGTVTVMPLITLTNMPATGMTSTSATLRATLACAGTNAAVYAHWNSVNGGTNAALWTNSVYVGSWTNVASTNLSLPVSGLSPQTQCYFTFRGTNLAGNVWATNVLSFTTLTPAPPIPVLSGSAITMSGGVPGFSFTTVAGYKYRLVSKNTLTDAAWLPVIAPPDFPLPDGWSATSTGAPMSLSDTSTAGQPQRFYRLEAANP